MTAKRAGTRVTFTCDRPKARCTARLVVEARSLRAARAALKEHGWQAYLRDFAYLCPDHRTRPGEEPPFARTAR